MRFFAQGYQLARIPTHQADCNDSIACARDMMDESAFTSAWDEGSKMSLDQVVALALHQDAPTEKSG
jgi:hypothetical protein